MVRVVQCISILKMKKMTPPVALTSILFHHRLVQIANANKMNYSPSTHQIVTQAVAFPYCSTPSNTCSSNCKFYVAVVCKAKLLYNIATKKDQRI